jgi:hypothetical protein
VLVRDDSLTTLFLWRARTSTMTLRPCGDTSARSARSRGVRTSRVPVESVTGSLRLANDADITIAIGIKTPSLLHAVASRKPKGAKIASKSP